VKIPPPNSKKKKLHNERTPNADPEDLPYRSLRRRVLAENAERLNALAALDRWVAVGWSVGGGSLVAIAPECPLVALEPKEALVAVEPKELVVALSPPTRSLVAYVFRVAAVSVNP